HLLKHRFVIVVAAVAVFGGHERVQGGEVRIAERAHADLPTTAIASPAWTSTVSPGPASTRATLISSVPVPVSARARPPPSSFRTRTGTAASEQVRHVSSPAHDGEAVSAFTGGAGMRSKKTCTSSHSMW